jgi:hypothetical protein
MHGNHIKRFDPNHESFLSAALFCATDHNWLVLPLYPNSRNPINLPAPWGATRDPTIIKRIWSAWPTANVAVATGKASGVFVIECSAAPDAIPQDEGQQMVITPSGTIQSFYKYLSPQQLKELGVSEMESVQVPGFFDLKADGAYVVLPPSVTGSGCYQWYH